MSTDGKLIEMSGTMAGGGTGIKRGGMQLTVSYTASPVYAITVDPFSYIFLSVAFSNKHHSPLQSPTKILSEFRHGILESLLQTVERCKSDMVSCSTEALKMEKEVAKLQKSILEPVTASLIMPPPLSDEEAPA
jgi:hypothetical protein